MGGKLSDGSYWSIRNITDLSDTTDLPDDGLFIVNLRIHQTYQTVSAEFHDPESGDHSRWTRELHHSLTRVPTLELPGTMNRTEYYLAFHEWIRSVNVELDPDQVHDFNVELDPDQVHDFTDQVLECVFGRVGDVDQKVAIYVSADLHLVPVTIEKDDGDYRNRPLMEDDDEDDEDPIMEVDEEDDDPMEDDEEYDPVEYVDEEEYEPMEDEEEEYDPVEFVEDNNGDESLIKLRVMALSDFCAVVAAEEHCKIGDCLICLEPLFSVMDEEEDEDEKKKKKKCLFGSPCGHYFHGECMSEWLTRSDSCPLCRFDVSSLIEQ